MCLRDSSLSVCIFCFNGNLDILIKKKNIVFFSLIITIYRLLLLLLLFVYFIYVNFISYSYI